MNNGENISNRIRKTKDGKRGKWNNNQVKIDYNYLMKNENKYKYKEMDKTGKGMKRGNTAGKNVPRRDTQCRMTTGERKKMLRVTRVSCARG